MQNQTSKIPCNLSKLRLIIVCVYLCVCVRPSDQSDMKKGTAVFAGDGCKQK